MAPLSVPGRSRSVPAALLLQTDQAPRLAVQPEDLNPHQGGCASSALLAAVETPRTSGRSATGRGVPPGRAIVGAGWCFVHATARRIHGPARTERVSSRHHVL